MTHTKYSVLVLLLISACMGGASAPTGAVCPTANAPTYQGFADAFFTKYCRDCHSSQATNRHGAPGSENFDTEADIQRHLAAIDQTSAGGPDSMNTSMPSLSGPVKSEPTDAEREQLGQYLACMKQ